MPAAATSAAGSSSSFTPQTVAKLPDAVKSIIIGAYNDALTPVFLYMVPLIIVALILLCFIKEVPLATSIQRDAVPESFDIDGGTHVLNGDGDAASESAADGAEPQLTGGGHAPGRN
jgi:hypothetical protein